MISRLGLFVVVPHYAMSQTRDRFLSVVDREASSTFRGLSWLRWWSGRECSTRAGGPASGVVVRNKFSASWGGDDPLTTRSGR